MYYLIRQEYRVKPGSKVEKLEMAVRELERLENRKKTHLTIIYKILR